MEHIKTTVTKVQKIAATLSKLMPNKGGPRSSNRIVQGYNVLCM